MSGRNIAIFVFLLISVLLIYFLYFYRPVHWYESLQQSAKQPYDLHFIKHLVENSPETKEFREVKRPLEKALAELTDEPALYIAMGPGIKNEEADIEALLEFVWQGNDAFISLKYIPNTLLQELIYWDDSLSNQGFLKTLFASKVNLYYPNTEEEHEVEIYFSDGTTYRLAEWYYFDYNVLKDTTLQATGYIDTKPLEKDSKPFYPDSTFRETGDMNIFINMLEVPIGEGKFILHTTPMVFSNLHLTDQEVLKYANAVLGQSQHRQIYWDAANIISLEEAFRQEMTIGRPGSSSRVMSEKEGPLYFILSVPAFRNAWYVLLGGSLLYLMFMAKRKQRPVPVIKPLENSSLEYMKTIGEVYFRNSSSKLMGIHILQGFLRDFYKTYRFPWEPKDPNLIPKLIKKSGLDKGTVEKAVRYISTVHKTKFFGDGQLIGLKQHMDKLLNIHKK